MPIPAQLSVSVKFKEIPEIVRTRKDGWRVYSVDCGDGRIMTFDLRPRMFAKLEAGAASFERWSAVVTGKMGTRHGNGFHIDEADLISIVENKRSLKEAKAAADGLPATSPAETALAPTLAVAEPASPGVVATAKPPLPKGERTRPIGPEVYRMVRGAIGGEGAVTREENDVKP